MDREFHLMLWSLIIIIMFVILVSVFSIFVLSSKSFSLNSKNFCSDRGYDLDLEHSKSLQKIRCGKGFGGELTTQDYRYEKNWLTVINSWEEINNEN